MPSAGLKTAWKNKIRTKKTVNRLIGAAIVFFCVQKQKGERE